MKLRMAEPSALIDLGGIAALRGIKKVGTKIVVGAMTTQHEILASALIARNCPILQEAARQIADPQVRYCGTIGGNVANGDPGNDMPAVMLALDAPIGSPAPPRRAPSRPASSTRGPTRRRSNPARSSPPSRSRSPASTAMPTKS